MLFLAVLLSEFFRDGTAVVEMELHGVNNFQLLKDPETAGREGSAVEVQRVGQ